MFTKKSREKAATGFLFTRGSNSNNNNSSKVMSEVKMPKIPKNQANGVQNYAQNQNQAQNQAYAQSSQNQQTSLQFLQQQMQNQQQVHNSGNISDLPIPPQIPPQSQVPQHVIPEMSKLSVSGNSLPKIDETPQISNHNYSHNRISCPSQISTSSSHSIQSHPIPQPPKTELCVVDEGLPRHCEYLGSFEVQKFQSPEERGTYITQQLYSICNSLEVQNSKSAENNNNKNKNPQENNSQSANLNGKQSTWPVCLVLTIAGIKVCHGFAHDVDKKIRVNNEREKMGENL